MTVESIRLDDDGRSLRLNGLRLENASVSIAVGRASLPAWTSLGRPVVGMASAASASIVLDDIKITSGTLVVSVPHAEASGSRLTVGEFAGIFDQASPDGLQDRLAKLTAAELRAPVVIVSNHVGSSAAEDPTLTFHDVALNEVAQGRIGAASAHDMVSSGGKQDADLSFSIGAMKLAHLDLPLALRVAQGARSEVGEPVRPVLTSLSIENVVLKASEGDMRLGALQVGEIRGRPLLLSPAAMSAIGEKRASERTPQERQSFADALIDAIASFALDRIEADDLTFRDDKDKVSFGMGATIVEGLEPGRLKLFAIERFSLSTAPADMTLGRVAIEGYDQSRLVEAMGRDAGTALPDGYITRFGPMAPTFAGFSLRAMRIDAQADDLKGNARQGRRNTFDVPTVDLALRRTPDTGLSAVAHGQMIYDIAADAPDAGLHQMVDMGFPHLDVSLDYRSTWSEPTRTLTFDQVAVAAQGMGSVGLSATVANVAPELFNSPGTEAATALARDAEIRSVRLDIADAGIAAKLWSMAADRAGISVPLLKAEAKGQVQAAVLQVLGDTPAATRVADAVSLFIDNSKTLMLSVKAPPGLSLKSLDPGGDPAVIKRLEIDAAAGR